MTLHKQQRHIAFRDYSSLTAVDMIDDGPLLHVRIFSVLLLVLFTLWHSVNPNEATMVILLNFVVADDSSFIVFKIQY